MTNFINIPKRGVTFIVLLVFLLSACERQETQKQYPLHYSDAIMGTSFTIKVSVIPDILAKDELKLEIKQLLDSINSQMSTYQEDSELSLFNKNISTQWQTVSNSLYSVLKEAQRISRVSQGAFDITVGPLVNLWGFGVDPASFKEPEESLINEQLAKIGYKNLLLNDKTLQIKKELPELYLDLSAIAKGYAVDRVGLLLEKNGIDDYMIEIGGELRLKGKNIQGQPWKIAVEKPTINQRMIQRILSLTNISLATSGDYRNFFERDGVRFSHTIDPRTGKPIKHKLASVTILSDTTINADALATAMMVLGAEQGYKIAEEQHIAALFIIKNEGEFEEKATTAFINYEVK